MSRYSAQSPQESKRAAKRSAVGQLVATLGFALASASVAFSSVVLQTQVVAGIAATIFGLFFAISLYNEFARSAAKPAPAKPKRSAASTAERPGAVAEPGEPIAIPALGEYPPQE